MELHDAGFSDILTCSFLQRLKGVSFLATMDYIYPIRHRFSRYDHSLGAAHLALNLSKTLELTKFQTEILVIAYLLHDIGHAPFSHASETFLLEKKRKYHEGLLSSYLRYNTRIFKDSCNLSEILENRKKEVKNTVTLLLLNNLTDDIIINNLYYSSINCDKIDGTNRALYALRYQHYDPLSMIHCLTKNGTEVSWVRREYKRLTGFWELKKELYKRFIYNIKILTAEAMLTRALEETIKDEESLKKFLSGTDKSILKILSKNVFGRKICNDLFNKKLFLPLSKIDYKLFNTYKNAIIDSRFDKLKRKYYEGKIADYFNLEPQLVISHFSFKKGFRTNLSKINQLNLFNYESENIPLTKLNEAFYTVKQSGEVFDIFVPINN